MFGEKEDMGVGLVPAFSTTPVFKEKSDYYSVFLLKYIDLQQ